MLIGPVSTPAGAWMTPDWDAVAEETAVDATVITSLADDDDVDDDDEVDDNWIMPPPWCGTRPGSVVMTPMGVFMMLLPDWTRPAMENGSQI